MKSFMDMRKHYLDQGYSSLGISTRTGAEIFRKADRQRVVKLTIAGKDPSVEFAEWAKNHSLDCFPRIHDMIYGGSSGDHASLNWRPCAIEMEELKGLLGEERDAYERWIASYLDWRSGRADQPEDTLQLFAGLEAAYQEADSFDGALGVEVRKPKNVMAREEGGKRRLVILDPWY